MVLVYNIRLFFFDKYGKCNKVVFEKEKIKCLNFLGYKFDFDSESKNVSLFKGNLVYFN